ncbi:MAG TPA: fatty acid desaturase [Acidimicrobiales bacterium]|nr:fatty acid desaturase [Acidimicrobiales bacterium]
MPRALLAVVVGLAVCQVANLLTTVYLHRALSHRALSLSPPVLAVCRFLIWIMTGIRPRQWVAVHRKHHAFTDVEGDPHSPVLLGYAKVQLGNVGLYRTAARDKDLVSRYARDLPADAWDRVLFDHAVVGLGVGVAFLCLVLGWQWGLVAGVIHAVTYLALSAAVNAVGHTFGRRTYDNPARNNQWLAWLTAGEGLHNNHHAAPTSARLAHGGGEIDPGWWAIRMLRRVGLATVRHDGARLKAPVAA